MGAIAMRVLVTGGAGFIGSNFVKLALGGSFPGISRITILDKLTYAGTLTNLDKLPKSDFDFVEGDICDEVLAGKLAKRHEAIINFAAESHVDRSITGSRNFVLTNVLGTQTLLEAARLGGTAAFVQVSTDEVYGSIPSGSWTESEPLMPNSPYAASKAAADLFARAFFRTYALDVRITRCSNNYGSNQFPEILIPLFITNLMNGLKVPVYGQGANIRDWLHVDDHCQGIHKVLFSEKSGEVFNIGGGEELTNLDITKLILEEMECNQSMIQSVEDRLGHDFRYSVDWSKIQSQLGYNPKVKFIDGIRDTIMWYRENTSWWEPLIKS